GMRESLELINHGLHDVNVEITIIFDADFADLFEVKDELTKKGELYRRREPHGITLGYVRGGLAEPAERTSGSGSPTRGTSAGEFRRETYIEALAGFFTEGSVTFRISLAPQQSWTSSIDVTVGTANGAPRPRRAPDAAEHTHQPEMPSSLGE